MGCLWRTIPERPTTNPDNTLYRPLLTKANKSPDSDAMAVGDALDGCECGGEILGGGLDGLGDRDCEVSVTPKDVARAHHGQSDD
jgi:hypothetical protein